MTGGRDRRQRMTLTLSVLLIAFSTGFSLVGAGSAHAQSMGDLYQANAIVTGTDMRQRPWGFAQCLREVLVKVSGNPALRHDPRVDKLAEHADKFVTFFDYVDLMAGQPKKDDQGTYDRPHRLTVRFDPGRIDKALADLGEHPWRGERPTVIPIVLVHGWKPPAYLLDLENPVATDQRDSFANAAGEFGIKYRIPTETELAAWGVKTEGFPEPKAKLPPSYVVVTGTLAWDEKLPGWTGAWRMRWEGIDHAWHINGVTFDAAYRDAIRGVMLLASGHRPPS